MRRHGFTLVELLVAMGSALLVATAAMLALSTSFRTWTRIATGGALLETHRGLYRLERDIASALPLPNLPLTGTSSTLTFPLERNDSLRISSWHIDGAHLIRRERAYRFDEEGDPNAPLPTTEVFRLPTHASFAYLPTLESPTPLREYTATATTNLPARIQISIGDLSRSIQPSLAPPPKDSIPPDPSAP